MSEKNGYRLEHLPESEFEREEKGEVNEGSMTDIVGKLQLLEDAGFTAIHMLEEKTEKPYYINSIASGERQFFSSMQEAMEGLAVEWEQSEQYFNDELRLALNEETGAWLDKQLPEGANARFDYQQEKAMTAADFAAQGARMEKAINARMAIAMEAEGMATGLSPKEVRVMGTNLSRVVKDMNLETIQTLYKGASPLTVFEERAEGLYDYFVHSGYFTQEQALAWLLQLEKQTDKRFIFYDNNKPIEEQYLNIKEGWSNAATSYAMGKLDDARIPAALRRWFRAIIQSVSELFKKDGFLQKAMKGNALNKLEKSGKMDAEFRQYLAESVGMNWTKEEQAYIEKAQEEVLAEAAGVSLSIGQNKSPESIHTQWKESLEEYLSGRNPKKDRDITVCPTPAVLRMLGAKAHDLVITPGVINKVMQDKHAVSREAMEGLSLAIENPIAVFESATSANSLVLLTELKEGENNIVVALLMDAQGVGENTSVKVNRVRSIYGKEGARSLISSPCLYVDTKKARSWVQIAGLQLPRRTPFRKGSKGKIHTPEDVVKWKDKSNVSFSVVSMDNTGKSLSAETFITKKDGNPDWFIIPKRAGQKEMPVRLLVGLDKGAHTGYGLNHLVASRVEDDLWEKTSPAKYISDILENASELYEVSPGRELLVKGKQPSSWMVLQLDRQEGYYSIITAYPASFRKKPLGRRIPLVEQLYDKRSQRVDRSQRPTNTESGTVRLGRGSVANAALLSQSAGRESATQLPAGSDSVNIKDVICQMNDGSKMNASFAITLPDGMQERENPKFLTRLQAIANSSNERKATALQAIISRIEGELRRQGYNLNGFPLAENSDSAQTRQAKLLKAIRYIDGMLGMLPKKLRGEVYGMSSNSEYLNLREAAMEEAIESEAAFNRHFGKIVSKVNNVLEREAFSATVGLWVVHVYWLLGS